MECAGRGIAFWIYQSSQEMYSKDNNQNRGWWLTLLSAYNEYFAKTVTDKCTQLKAQMDTLAASANTELEMLNEKLSGQWELPSSQDILNEIWRYGFR